MWGQRLGDLKSYFTSYKKIYLKCVIDLNIKANNIKLKKNTGKRQHFLEHKKALATEKNYKLDFTRIKDWYSSKNINKNQNANFTLRKYL